MCNLYTMTSNHTAIREMARTMREPGNLPLLPGIYPDFPTPIVRTGVDGVRKLVQARWGHAQPSLRPQGPQDG